MPLPEIEIVFCKCGHQFDAFHNDLGTYMCPECFDNDPKKVTPKEKPLDVAFKKMESYVLSLLARPLG